MSSNQARIYYNVEIKNDTDNDIPAAYDSGGLLAPLITNPEDYELSVVRFRIPTSTIPVFPENLPYEQLQVGLDYQNTAVVETVRQYGATEQASIYYYAFSQRTIFRYNVSSSGNLSNLLSFTIPNSINGKNVNQIQDLITHGPNVYLALQDANGLSTHQDIVITDSNFQNFTNYYQNFTQSNNPYIKILINADKRLFFAYTYFSDLLILDLDTGQLLLRSGLGVNYHSIAATPNFIFSASTSNVLVFQVIRGPNNEIGLNYLAPPITYPLPSGNDFTFITEKNNFVYILPRKTGQSNHYIYRFPAGQSATIDKTYTFTATDPVTGITSDGTYLYVLRENNRDIIAINIESSVVNPSSTPYPVGAGISSIFGYIDDTRYWIENKTPIYKINEFISCINDAYSRALTKLKTLAPPIASFEPPFINFDAPTKLFTMYAPVEYSQTNFNIYMNPQLYKYFDFLATHYIGQMTVLRNYYNISIINLPINNIILNNNTHYIQMTQERSTLSRINQLTKIVITSSHLPIIGDVQGNSRINYITDFTPDTTVPGELLILYPTIMRFYSLFSNREIRQIDLQVYYSTNNQDFQKLYIEPGESCSVKLEFRNKNASSSY